MTTKRYCVFLIPSEFRADANILMAFVNGDDPMSSNSFSQRANTTGNPEDTITHYFGGMFVTESWLETVSNLATNPPVIPEEITIGDTTAAASAIHLQVTITQDEGDPSPQATLASALTALGLQRVSDPL